MAINPSIGVLDSLPELWIKPQIARFEGRRGRGPALASDHRRSMLAGYLRLKNQGRHRPGSFVCIGSPQFRWRAAYRIADICLDFEIDAANLHRTLGGRPPVIPVIMPSN